MPDQHNGKARNQGTKKIILGTTHILWIVLIHKYQTFNMRKNITSRINYK